MSSSENLFYRYEKNILDADIVRWLGQRIIPNLSEFDNVTSDARNETVTFPGFTRYFRNGTKPTEAGAYFTECTKVEICNMHKITIFILSSFTRMRVAFCAPAI